MSAPLARLSPNAPDGSRGDMWVFDKGLVAWPWGKCVRLAAGDEGTEGQVKTPDGASTSGDEGWDA